MRHFTFNQIEDLLAGHPAGCRHCQCPRCQGRLAEAKAIRQRLRRAFLSVQPSPKLRESIHHLLRTADKPPVVGVNAKWPAEARYSMKAQVDIEAGVCGFRTHATAASEDGQQVTFAIETDCETIGQLDTALAESQPLDAFQEISPADESVLMATVRQTLKGCCAGCAVPVGLFKAMQVAAGLALPKDLAIRLTRQSS